MTKGKIQAGGGAYRNPDVKQHFTGNNQKEVDWLNKHYLNAKDKRFTPKKKKRK